LKTPVVTDFPLFNCKQINLSDNFIEGIEEDLESLISILPDFVGVWNDENGGT